MLYLHMWQWSGAGVFDINSRGWLDQSSWRIEGDFIGEERTFY